jgi:hypothetical protein
VTELEKRIYNKHLAVSRSLRNKPFKLKNDFTDFEKDSRYVAIRRINTLVNKYPDIDLDVYFMAPYKLYKDVEYFDLNYFASPRAIKSYTIYKQELTLKSPDSQWDDIKKSLRYIGMFCLKHKIDLTLYPTFKLTGSEPEWIYQLKKGEINIYSLMEFSGIYDLIDKMPEDTKELLLGNYGTKFTDFRSAYLHSSNVRLLLPEAYNTLKIFIDKELNTSNSIL